MAIRKKKKTDAKGGNNNPRWSTYLEFSKQRWTQITVKIMDQDGGWGQKDDPLCPTKVIQLKYAKSTESYYCHPGKAYVNIRYVD